MTLSAKQIIADREVLSAWGNPGSETTAAKVEAATNRRWTRLATLEDFYLSQQPRPIAEAKSGEKIHACWLDDDGAITTISTVIWTLTGRWVLPPTHFIPLDALPLPEGE